MNTQPSRVVLEINLGAIRRNFRKLREHVAPLKLMGVLKANAYGLGVKAIAKTLKEEGIELLGVADPKEADEISDLRLPILILGSILPTELPSSISKNYRLPIPSFEVAELIQEKATQVKQIAKCHVLVDTGMGRLGLPLEQATDQIKSILKMPNIHLEGIYSHFPSAYTDEAFSNAQIEKLLKVIDDLKSIHQFSEIHISNSDGIHNIPKALQDPFTIARTGINLYGCFDLEGRRTLQLEEAISIKSRLVAIRQLKKGDSVGYGRTCVLGQSTTIGTVAIGYADGVPLHFTDGYLVVGGKKCPILGRTSMDYTTIDLSHSPDATLGDEVICLGSGITTSDWANAKSTIPYEVICSIGNRVERKLIND